GTTIAIAWTTANQGTGATIGGWVDRLYLSTDDQFSAGDRLLGSRTFGGPLGAGEVASGTPDVTVPVDLTGAVRLLLVTDATAQVNELDGENNNLVTRALDVQMAPYADLTVSGVTATDRLIGDPATLSVTWTVANQGTGVGLTPDWVDVVYASTDTVLGNGNGTTDDIVLGRFAHTGGLDANASYTLTRGILLPPAFTGRFHIFLHTDPAR